MDHRANARALRVNEPGRKDGFKRPGSLLAHHWLCSFRRLLQQLHIPDIRLERHIEEVAHPWQQTAGPFDSEVGGHSGLNTLAELVAVGDPEGVEAGERA